MIILSPATQVLEPTLVEVGGYTPGIIGRLLGHPKIPGRFEPNPNFGHVLKISDAIIDFEETPCVVGMRHHEDVAFGTHLYEGITPIAFMHDNVYKCSVNNVRHVRSESQYVPPQEFR